MATYLHFAFATLAFLSGFALLLLALADLMSKSFSFWPPPDSKSWQNSAFRTLFRIMFYGLVTASLVFLWQSGLPALTASTSVGVVLIILGFVIALAATGTLGWSNAFGSKEGLRTNGIFAYSRNPIYVATWLGLAGWALILPTPIIVATLTCWAVLYLIAVFLEERWLGREYGEAFESYCRKVRRFV